jgi:hypothetical protein
MFINFITKNLLRFSLFFAAFVTQVHAQQTTFSMDYQSGGTNVRAISVPQCANPQQSPQELKVYGVVSVARSVTLYSSSAPVVNFTVSPSQADSSFRLGGVQFNNSLPLPGFTAALAPNQTQQSLTAQNFTSQSPLKVFTGQELAAIYNSSPSPRRRFVAITQAPSSTQADSANLMYVTLTNINLSLVLDLICQ